LERDYRRKRDSLQGDSPSGTLRLTAEDIKNVLGRESGLWESDLTGLEAALSTHIFGQEEAVKAVCRTVRRGLMGLADGDHPLASLLFLGPSGVGKTEMAKVLSRTLFGSERALLRLDMSEYSEKQSLSKLIGSPPGYVGYGEEGLLTAALRRRPHTLILFDEAEKAHPEVVGLLLQILDHGFLTDAAGHHVDFRSSLVILTANTHAETAAERGVGFTPQIDTQGEGDAVARRLFRPELIGRLDAVVPFRALSTEAAEAIVRADLARLTSRLLERTVVCDVMPSVVSHLVREGFSSRYGARPLKRLVREEVEDPLLLHLSENPLKAGESLLCEEENGKIFVKTVTKRQVSHMM
jgi:ATP-dependent Clp protease ATP-binding subunit ClpC